MAGTTHPETFVNLHCLVNGVSLNKKLTDCTPPKMKAKVEGVRYAGTDAELDMDTGLEKLEFNLTGTGFIDPIEELICNPDIMSAQFEMRGAYRDARGVVRSATIILRGKVIESDGGSWKPGDKGERKYAGTAAYYELMIDGKTYHKIDPLNNIRIIAGTDMMEKVNQALGLPQ